MIAPTRLVRISGKRKYVEPWLTPGIENSSRMMRKLYKVSIMHGTSKEDVEKYKNYRNVCNHTKRAMRQKYYQDKSTEYKSNTKKIMGVDEWNY